MWCNRPADSDRASPSIAILAMVMNQQSIGEWKGLIDDTSFCFVLFDYFIYIYIHIYIFFWSRCQLSDKWIVMNWRLIASGLNGGELRGCVTAWGGCLTGGGWLGCAGFVDSSDAPASTTLSGNGSEAITNPTLNLVTTGHYYRDRYTTATRTGRTRTCHEVVGALNTKWIDSWFMSVLTNCD